MSKKEDEPAFPSHAQGIFLPHFGLTKREYFAGLAMQAILGGITSDVTTALAMGATAKEKNLTIEQAICRGSVQTADDLLAELEKKK